MRFLEVGPVGADKQYECFRIMDIIIYLVEFQPIWIISPWWHGVRYVCELEDLCHDVDLFVL